MSSDSYADTVTSDGEAAPQPATPAPGGELETLAEPALEVVAKLPPSYETVTQPGLAAREDGGEGAPEQTHASHDTVQDDPEVAQAARLVRQTTRRVASNADTGDLRDAGPSHVGRYEIRELLGEGGCGAVYAAWDPRHEREVAVKLMFRADARGKQRYLRELRAIARLRHPHIVPLLDSGEHEGRPYLVMARVRGPSLAAASKASTSSGQGPVGEPAPGDATQLAPLTLEQRVTVVRDACRAIQHAHAQGILHRDVKPQNVLIDQHGEALVVDFGLARSTTDETMTRTGAPLGTPAYIPPEQAGAFDGEVTERSDVYSLGATLYHALTGRPPFLGRGEELLVAVLTQLPRAPSALCGEVPEELDAVALRCLEKEPARRYASAGELAQELDRFIRGEPVEARRVGALGRALHAARRHRLVTALGASMLVSLVVILILLWQNWQLRHPGGSP